MCASIATDHDICHIWYAGMQWGIVLCCTIFSQKGKVMVSFADAVTTILFRIHNCDHSFKYSTPLVLSLRNWPVCRKVVHWSLKSIVEQPISWAIALVSRICPGEKFISGIRENTVSVQMKHIQRLKWPTCLAHKKGQRIICFILYSFWLYSTELRSPNRL